jgi:hypothetical protein
LGLHGFVLAWVSRAGSVKDSLTLNAICLIPEGSQLVVDGRGTGRLAPCRYCVLHRVVGRGYRTARAVPLLCASQRCWPGDRTARAVPLLCFGTGRLAPCRFCVLHSITDEWGSRGNNKGTEVARFATRRQGCIVKTRGKQDCARSNCRETINERNREHLETAAKDLRHRSPNR